LACLVVSSGAFGFGSGVSVFSILIVTVLFACGGSNRLWSGCWHDYLPIEGRRCDAIVAVQKDQSKFRQIVS
jgi:hypothetical protein